MSWPWMRCRDAHALIDELIGESQDAFVLLTLLQRHHWGRSFVLADAMADQLGWTRKRFAAAGSLLQALGFIQMVTPANFRSPAIYRLGTGVVMFTPMRDRQFATWDILPTGKIPKRPTCGHFGLVRMPKSRQRVLLEVGA